MSYTNDLIDEFKAREKIASDYAAARALGLRANRISNYRTSVSHADDKTAILLADALGLDRLETIARINSDRATDATDKKFWRGIAAAALMSLVLVPFSAFADTPKGSTNAYYVK